MKGKTGEKVIKRNTFNFVAFFLGVYISLGFQVIAAVQGRADIYSACYKYA